MTLLIICGVVSILASVAVLALLFAVFGAMGVI